MANYYGTARTNYFRVKDEAAFREWAKKRNIEIMDKDNAMFALFPDNSDDGTFRLYDEALDDFVDIPEELSQHLADGSVAIFMEIGSEKSRYVIGEAIAINSKGKRITVDISDIYKRAQRLGDEITRAEY